MEPNGTPPPLPELAARIQAEADAFALTMGLLFDQAKLRNRGRYSSWVRSDTPFTLAEAERLRAIAVCYRDLPEAAVKGLPRPSSALSFVLEEADPKPFESSTHLFSREDLLVGGLLGSHPEALGSDVRRLLVEWLGGLSTDDSPATT